MKRAVVIGLGIFGHNIARGLFENGLEVVAIDKRRMPFRKSAIIPRKQFWPTVQIKRFLRKSAYRKTILPLFRLVKIWLPAPWRRYICGS